MSYHDLIPKMRSALRFLGTKGLAMEKRWTAQLSLQNITKVLSAPGRHSRTDEVCFHKDMYGKTLMRSSSRTKFLEQILWLIAHPVKQFRYLARQ
jgi:hypothetical protein